MFSSVLSKFKPGIYLVGFLYFLLPVAYALTAFIYLIPSGVLKNPTIQYVFAASIGVLNPLVGIYFMRKRLFKLEVSDYGIKGRAFFGFGKEKEWPYAELDGYTVNVSEGKDGKLTETLKFLKSAKVELEVSDAVYSNLDEMKQAIAAKLKAITV